ncbi:hypothetical protein [Leeuwenhoekiella aequorea]|uniref:Uncharacterized protein n=1 Tax=Leeuwenhoekiella aequorea TaxID=283736 RepID=A0A4Q0PCC4_9FLAO|nr:hypothetical protein [Leeuwenhoekiella aequorea]RXG24291.1 hypothetical protein DSM00_77 [Leeuwenhoekiella aequorea]
MPFIVDLPPTSKSLERTYIQRNTNDKESGDISDINTLKLDQDLMEQVYLSARFDILVENWKNNTMFQSSISKITSDQNFMDIIEMGERAIPLIINEIEKEPSVLVWALNIITNNRIDSRQRLTVTEACKKWVSNFKRGKIRTKTA